MNNIELIDAIVSGDKERADEIFQASMKETAFEVLDEFRKQVSALSVNLKDTSNGAE